MFFVLAATAAPPFLAQVVAMVMASAVIAYVCHKRLLAAAVVDELEIGVQLFTRVLSEYQVSLDEIDDHVTPGDRVTARGSADAFAEAARLLRAATRVEDGGVPMRTIRLTEEQRTACAHGASVQADIRSTATGCEDCLKIGDTWVHLRMCMTCGGVRCCDSSKNRHATRHHEATGHPIIRSYQPGELWAWCDPDERML